MQVEISGPARADLVNVALFIAEDNAERALSFIAEIEAACLALGNMPERYAFLPGFETIGYRKRIYRNYLIIYQIGQARIEIIRVVHGAADYSKLLIAKS